MGPSVTDGPFRCLAGLYGASTSTRGAVGSRPRARCAYGLNPKRSHSATIRYEDHICGVRFMTVYLDQEIEGNGSYNFGAAQIQYALVELDVLGPSVFVNDLTNADQLLNAGWFAFGSTDTYGTAVSHPFWTERKWINFQSFQWHPEPTRLPAAASDLCIWATHVRWALSPGTHGFMLIVGI